MRFSKQIILLMVLALVVALSACNSSPEAQMVDDEVKLQLDWVHQAQFAGYYVAQQEDIYDEHNLRVELEPGGPDIDVLQRVADKEVDFAVVANPAQLLQGIEAGQPVVAIAVVFQKDPQVWISRAEDNITTPADMVGKRVGVQAANEAAYRMLLTVSDIDADQLEEIPTNDFTIRPLVEGEVDVLPAYALNEPLTAQAQGLDINTISLSQLGVFFPSEILLTHKDTLAQNPDLVDRFVDASMAGWQQAVDDPEKGLEATMRVDETLNPDLQRSMMEATIALVSPETAPVGHMDQETWQETLDLVRDQGLVSEQIDLSNVFTTQFLQQ